MYDEETNEFTYSKDVTLQLEHSLISVSLWESKWHKPFLHKDEDRTLEQTIDYVRCMTINKNVDPSVYLRLSNDDMKAITDYIDNPMTATTFNNQQNKGPMNREIVTAEIIYYWMVALQIPFECEKWHLNRLITLIEVCNIKNTPPKKMGKGDIARQNHALNKARHARKH